MNIKNAIISFLIWCTNALPRTKRSDGPRRILIVSTTGLGDTLWATPAIKALRSSFPTAYIGALTSTIGYEVLSGNRHLDDIFVVQEPPLFPLLKLYRTLRKKKFETILIFHTSQRPVLPFCHLLRPTDMIGTTGINKGFDHLLTKVLPKNEVHELQRRLDIAAAAGAHTLNPSLELFINEDDEKSINQFLQKHKLLSYLPIICMHPGAKDTFKQWPPESFIEIGNRLSQQLGAQIIITGTAAEEPLVKEIARQIPGAIAAAGVFTLKTLAALLKRANLMITNDTGPMHIAYAMNTPTIALFSPTDPKLCGPYFAQKALPIAKPRACNPCLRKKCLEPFCMLQIHPDEVFEAAQTFLHHKT